MANRKTAGATSPPTTITFIEWIDASSQAGPVTRADLTGVHHLRSVGWLVRENAEHISICQDYVPATDEFRDVLHILKRNVIKRREFKVK